MLNLSNWRQIVPHRLDPRGHMGPVLGGLGVVVGAVGSGVSDRISFAAARLKKFKYISLSYFFTVPSSDSWLTC